MEFTRGKAIEQVVWKSGINTGGADVVTGVAIDEKSGGINTTTSKIYDGGNDNGTIISGGPAPSRPLYEQLAAHRARAEEEALRSARPVHNAPAGLDEDEIRFLEEQHELRSEQAEREKQLDLIAKEEYETAAMFSTAAATAAASLLSEGVHERQKEEEKKRLVDTAAKSATSIATAGKSNLGGGLHHHSVRPTSSFKSLLVVKKAGSHDSASASLQDPGLTLQQHSSFEGGSKNKRTRDDTLAMEYAGTHVGEINVVDDKNDHSSNKLIKLKEEEEEEEEKDVQLGRRDAPPTNTMLSVSETISAIKLPPPPFLAKKQKVETASTSLNLVDYEDDD